MERRFGERAQIVYLDATGTSLTDEQESLVGAIKDRGLVYPVTVVDGQPMYDGAVSYPAIMRAIESRIGSTTTAE